MSNVDTARAAYEAFSSGDMDALREMFADHAEWVTSDELPLGGHVAGGDAIMDNFSQIPDYWTDFSVEPEEFMDCGDNVVVRGTQRASSEGGSFEAPFMHLLRFREGKVVYGEFLSDTAKELRALGSKATA